MKNAVPFDIESPSVYMRNSDASFVVGKDYYEYISLFSTNNADKSGAVYIDCLNKTFMAVPCTIREKYRNLHAFTVYGGAMMPIMSHGDIVLVTIYDSPPEKIDNKKIYLFKINQKSGEAYIFRKARVTSANNLILLPLNLEDELIEINTKKEKPYKNIIGHAVWQWKNIDNY
ncbi:MAG: S24 family peptidase [Deferribacterales bacterium]